MEKLCAVAGMPRSGSTLLCNILNMNPDFHATSTSGIVGVMEMMKKTFSDGVLWRTQNRLELYDDYLSGIQGFIEGFYSDKKVVFDKNRGWVNTNNIRLIDEVFKNNEVKFIWTYRAPLEVIKSVELQYRKHALLTNTDENKLHIEYSSFMSRLNYFMSDTFIISPTVWWLFDAIEMGYQDRILIVKYQDICKKTQETMDKIHDFIGEKKSKYNPKELKQTTFEDDSIYNYKYPHTIKEGSIDFKKNDLDIPSEQLEIINKRFKRLNDMVKMIK